MLHVNVNESAGLTPEQKAKVHSFSNGPTDLGHTDLIEHEIHLSDNRPFKDSPRNIPPGLINEIKEHLDEMLECEAIRPSSSPFSSNVIVRKKDGTIRFCIDFRKLNQRIIRDAYSIPKIEKKNTSFIIRLQIFLDIRPQSRILAGCYEGRRQT